MAGRDSDKEMALVPYKDKPLAVIPHAPESLENRPPQFSVDKAFFAHARQHAQARLSEPICISRGVKMPKIARHQAASPKAR
jgi:hypothetical protein